ncbi:MAG: DNA primase [Pseudomonadota bacterium]
MKGLIHDQTIREILHAANITDVISEYVTLKKTGRNFTGLCPFHAEKTPSFTVNEEKQLFHCFGCGLGGNVFSFLVRYHQIGFPEAVREVAKKYGIKIPTQSMSPEEKKRLDERETIFQINKLALEYFSQSLANPSLGERGRGYLKKRSIPEGVVASFFLGYAPSGWNGAVNFLAEKKIPLSLVEKAGLIIKKQNSNAYYDRFRDRIIFPILDVSGNVIGFGGRVLDDQTPKYLNSPETLVYHKGRSLYGLRAAKSFCRGAGLVYITEGYFDLLALVSCNILNVVATLGTALTREHVNILKRYARTAYLVFDSDKAGIKAVERSIPLFSQEKMSLKIMRLPQGDDPDSFISKYGSQPFLKKSEEAVSAIPYLLSYYIESCGLTVEGKAQIIERIKPCLVALPDSVERSLHIKEIAEHLGIDESLILREVKRSLPRDARPVEAKKSGISVSDGYRIEEGIIQMMIQFPEIITEIRDKNILEDFESQGLKDIGEHIINTFSDSGGLASTDIIACLEDSDLMSRLTSFFLDEQPWNHEKCLKRLSQFRQSIKKKGAKLLSRKIKEAEHANDQDKLARLLNEKKEWITASKGGALFYEKH